VGLANPGAYLFDFGLGGLKMKLLGYEHLCKVQTGPYLARVFDWGFSYVAHFDMGTQRRIPSRTIFRPNQGAFLSQ